MKLSPAHIMSCLMMLLMSVSAFGQVEKPRVKLDTLSMRIGEQTKLRLCVDYRVDLGAVNLKWPEIGETINERIVVIEKSKIDTIMPNKDDDPYQFRQEQTLLITCFDSGYAAIPPFEFVANNDTLASDPVLLQVMTVETDTTAAIKDIAEIIDIPFDFKKWLAHNWGWFAGGAGVILLAVAAILVFKRLKTNETQDVQEVVKIKEPAHVIALRRLDELRELKLWQGGQVKEYHSRLSEILREYIENRYAVRALEQTTDEILRNTQHCDIPSESRRALTSLLLTSDMAKFAKAEPVASENEQAFSDASAFVQQTLIKPTSEPSPESDEQEVQS